MLVVRNSYLPAYSACVTVNCVFLAWGSPGIEITSYTPVFRVGRIERKMHCLVPRCAAMDQTYCDGEFAGQVDIVGCSFSGQ